MNSDDKQLHPVARLFTWVDAPDGPSKIFWGLALICAALALSDLFYHRHAETDWEAIPAFYAIVGFVVYVTIIFLAKGLRLIVRRPENYYAPRSIDVEDERAAGTDPHV